MGVEASPQGYPARGSPVRLDGLCNPADYDNLDCGDAYREYKYILEIIEQALYFSAAFVLLQ
jgi:hypothetical protein